MAWIPLLTLAEKTRLKELLVKAQGLTWISQKSRHSARKIVMEVERAAEGAAE